MAWLFSILFVASALFLVSCDLDQASAREENYVTVRLDDSLSRFDSVLILILADGDTSSVIGKVWDGRLAEPQEIPPYRLDDGKTGSISIQVKGYDESGRLVLDMRIAKENGAQVVTNMALPKPSPALSSLALVPGLLSPAFDPAVKEYAVALAYNQTRLQVTMVPAYPKAVMSAGRERAYSGKGVELTDLRVGANRIVLGITAADTSTQYIINATRARAPDDTTKVPPDTVKVPPDTLSQGSPFTAWKHKASISIDFAREGADMATEVRGFPILLRLSNSNFTFSEAGENGKDLRFTTLDHRILPHEIAFWDAGAGSGQVWIKTDTLGGPRSIKSFLMYWGNPSAASASDPAKVFPEGSAWSGVWHLEEEGKGAAGEYQDATGRYDGTASGRAAPSRIEGVIGYAQDFKTANDQGAISIPAAFDPGATAWTINFWVKQESQGKGAIFAKGDGTDRDRERFQLITQEDGKLGAQRYGGRAFTNIFLPVGVWCQVGIVSNGTAAQFYLDGQFRESVTGGQGPDALAKVFLGALDANGLEGYNGSLDEVWFSYIAHSKDFMRMLFESQKPNSTIITVQPL